MNLISMVTLKCPKCGEGKIFKAPFRMNETCSSCGFKYEREDGYFTNAAVIASIFYSFIVAPILLIMAAQDDSVTEIAWVLGIVTVITIPIIFHYSRSIWLYFDYMANPE